MQGKITERWLTGWEREHFFIYHEGNLGNQESMITWCYLAETEFEKELQKRIASEFDLNTVISS